MKGEKNPKRVFEQYQRGELDRSATVEIFKLFIEQGTRISDRARSLEYLGKLEPFGDELFELFESYMISDINPVVRSSAVKVIIQNFLKVGLRSLTWVIQNDASNLVLRTLIKMLEEKFDNNGATLRNEVLLRFSKIFQLVPKEAKFFIDLFMILNKLGNPMDISINYVENFSFRTSSFHYCTTAGYKPKFINVRNNHVYALYLGGLKLKQLPDSIALLTRLRFLTIFKFGILFIIFRFLKSLLIKMKIF